MKVFADTNFFTNLWVALTFNDEADALFQSLRCAEGPLPVTRLVRMEFTNALQRLVFETRHGSQIVRVSPEAALMAKAVFDEELGSGELLRWQEVSADALENMFDDLCYRHTAREGFRTYDILHVATALMLGCDTFWSFDVRAKKLAQAEGLHVN